MKKRIFCMLLACALVFSAGCAAAENEVKEGRVFTDHMDRQVSIEKTPERVAVLIGSFADVWCLAGGKDSIVAAADDTWTQFDLGLSEDVIHLGE